MQGQLGDQAASIRAIAIGERLCVRSGDDAQFKRADLESLASLIMSDSSEDDPELDMKSIENYTKFLENEILATSSVREYSQEQRDENADAAASEELLYSLILNCAQAIDNHSSDKAYNLALQIRQKANPRGLVHERVAWYFAEALIARITGIGSLLFDMLRQAHFSQHVFQHLQVITEKCPNIGAGIYFCNQSILDAATNAKAIHVIDFGIRYGYRFMPLMRDLSRRPGGPPKFKLSGVELPDEYYGGPETCKSLGMYARELGVPFEFHSVLEKRWDTLTAASFAISADEVLIVSCLYRLRNVPKSARQKLLLNIHKLKPRIFILAANNAACNSRSLVSKVHGALKFYTGFFGLASKVSEDTRLFMESYLHGLDILSLIACKERSDGDGAESYKRWELRFLHAGFEQLRLAPHILNDVMLRLQGDFTAYRHGNWLLLGWKEHILHALAVWRPSDCA